MVALVSAWHERHAKVLAEVERRLDDGETLVIAGHALLESFSVLTRLPAPHRLSGADARAVLEASFGEAEITALTGAGYRALLRHATDAGITGGRAYDALIGECALRAKATSLLTLNERDFAAYQVRGLTIAVP